MIPKKGEEECVQVAESKQHTGNGRAANSQVLVPPAVPSLGRRHYPCYGSWAEENLVIFTVQR